MGKKMKEVKSALWSLELNIVCPVCENYFDYLQTDEYYNGGFEGLYHAKSDPKADIKVKCPECKAELLIKETEY